MTPNGFARLAVTTAVATIVAALLYASSNTWSTGIVTGEPMLSSLAKSAADVAAVELKQGALTLTLKRSDGDRWGIAERGGFPVVRQPLRQWQLRITAYADRLADELDRFGIGRAAR